MDPEARLSMVLMFQLLPNRTELRERFYNLVYQALMDAPVGRRNDGPGPLRGTRPT